MRCSSTVWLRNPTVLFCDFALLPMTHMNPTQQVNAMTRFLVIIALILYILDFKYTLPFLVLGILCTIIFYFVKRKKDSMNRYKENFTHYPSYSAFSTPDRQTVSYFQANTAPERVKCKSVEGLQVSVSDQPGLTPLSAYRYCNDSVPLDYNDPNYVSPNQKLVGKANPKTLIAPVIAPPSCDLSYWRANNLIIQSNINEESQYDAYQSGEAVSTCCGFMNDDTYLVPDPSPVSYAVEIGEDPLMRNRQHPTYKKKHTPVRHDSAVSALATEIHPRRAGDSNLPREVKETFTMDGYEYEHVFDNDIVNKSDGYNPQQSEIAGLPTNYNAGRCKQLPAMKTYNDNMFTETVMPGVYSRSEIVEPINANMGISYTQQIPPTTVTTDQDTGDMFYTEHDPQLGGIAQIEPNLATLDPAERSDVYDPRHSGYGTSYRSYVDEMTGQPKFYYDDVDAVTMPNYITRNNIDFIPFADQYGPSPAGEAGGNKFTPQIHALANDAFLRSTLEQRTSIAQSAMRKNNAIHWQRRMAPINTGGQRMTSGR